MYGPTAEKGYSHRPELTSGASRVVLLGLNRVDCVPGPDVQVVHDYDAPPRKARRPFRLTPAKALAFTVALWLLAAAWPACAPF